MAYSTENIATAVREIWATELKVVDFHSDDNFFALGGESLGAATVVEAANRRLGLDLSLKDLYRHATLASFTACIIAKCDKSAVGVELDSVVAVEQVPMRRASLSQEWNLRFSEHPSQDTANPFLIQQALRLRGVVDIERIRFALDAVVHRHELLRTVFRKVGDETFLDTAPTGRIPLEQFDFEDRAAINGINAGADRGFDRYAAPMIRCQLSSLTATDHVLLFVLDHIIADGGSLEILLSDFSNLYAGRKLAPVRIPFSAWAEAQRRSALDMPAVSEYWRTRLGDDPHIVSTSFELFHHPETQRADGTTISLTVAESAVVRVIARRLQVTVFSLFLGSFLMSLRERVSGENHCVVTTAMNRTGDTADILGPLAHDVYIPMNLTADRDLRESSQYAQQATGESLTHAVVPNTTIVEWLWPESGPDLYSLPAFYFSANRRWASRFQLPGVDCEDVRFAPHMPMPGLECTLEDAGSVMTLSLRHLAGSFPAGYARALGAEVIKRILDSSVDDN